MGSIETPSQGEEVVSYNPFAIAHDYIDEEHEKPSWQAPQHDDDQERMGITG
jgi:hypothetical protein